MKSKALENHIFVMRKIERRESFYAFTSSSHFRQLRDEAQGH